MAPEKRGFAVLQAVFLGVLVVLLWRRGVYPGVVIAVLFALSAVVAASRRRALWLDLGPFLILLITYQALRPFVETLRPEEIHVVDLIEWERMLTGGMPAAWLRESVTGASLRLALDGLANLAYFSHFLVPVGLAVWLHRKHPMAYWPMVTLFLGLCYAGFVTYVQFPAAPPWWATREGYLVGAEAVGLQGFWLSTESMLSTPDPLAAMPSMHCAFPLFWSMVLARYSPRHSIPLFGLTLVVAVAVVYLGHHYVIDIVAGWIYGLAAGSMVWLFRWPGFSQGDETAGAEPPV